MEPLTEGAPGPSSPPDAEPASVTLRCWGTRGSIPSPGPATAGYGGNTPCLEVTVGGRRLIFDAGTGIRLLGAGLTADGEPPVARIFLTHFHWDHIQGFPFFTPLYDPGARLEIFGPKQASVDIATLFAGQMGPIYFPIPFSAVAAAISFHHMNDAVWEDDGIRVTSMRVRHPSYTVGYRLEAGNRVICYVPDNELEQGEYDVGEGWRDRFLEFISGADILFHDAMFTEEEYPAHVGWGHSTFRQTLELAADADVRRLFFFHHAPDRTDAELNRILPTLREEAERRGLDFEVHAAFEGKQVRIEED